MHAHEVANTIDASIRESQRALLFALLNNLPVEMHEAIGNAAAELGIWNLDPPPEDDRS